MTDLGVLEAGWWWAAGALLVLTVGLSILAGLLERSGPIRLHSWAEEGGPRLARLYHDAGRFEGYRLALSLGAALAPLALGAVLERILRPHFTVAASSIGSAFLIVALVILFCEVFHRRLTARSADRALELATPIYRVLLWPALPVVTLTAPLFHRPQADPEDDEEELSDGEIDAFVDLGAQEGILEPGGEALLRRLVEFNDILVRSVMTPRIEMVGAPVESSLEELVQIAVESGHSRLPLYDGSVDHIAGIVFLRDVLRAQRAGVAATARDLAKAAAFVPETKPVDQLLREFQAGYQQVAIVVDEFGGTAGLVTVEDVLEQLVGDLADEGEQVTAEREELADGSWRLDGATEIEVLEELYGDDWDESPYETVGGLVFGLFGYVPRVGESVADRGLRFTVEEVAERRVTRMRVERDGATKETESG
jgi:CBS domain containing-hemolysin-like protein